MPYVKLDTGILNSTLWVNRDERDIFITALLMAEPVEVTEPTPQLAVDKIEETGFTVPPGWYGMVPAAGPGIVRRALVDQSAGMEALRRLGEPDHESRSQDFEGRRLVRVNGGYIALNYMTYREKDHTSTERQRRWREKKRNASTLRDNASTASNDVTDTRNITQAEAEAEVIKNNPVAPAALPDWLDADQWRAWIKIRPAKARTPEALQAALRKLEAFRSAGHDPNKILETSLSNGWQGLFEPDKKSLQTVAPIATRPSIICHVCSRRAYIWTDGKCEPCWKKSQGIAA